MLQLRLEKVDQENGIICLCFLLELWPLNCLIKVQFLQLCADLSKKPKSVEASYIYAPAYMFSEIFITFFQKTI